MVLDGTERLEINLGDDGRASPLRSPYSPRSKEFDFSHPENEDCSCHIVGTFDQIVEKCVIDFFLSQGVMRITRTVDRRYLDL